MKNGRRNFLRLAGLGAATSLAGCDTTTATGKEVESVQSVNWQADPRWRAVRYGAWKGPGVAEGKSPMDSILLKDYAPLSTLVTEKTLIPTARFPVIDVHVHHYYPDRDKDADPETALANWVTIQREVAVEKSVVLTGATGQRFETIAKRYLTNHAEQFQVYCGIDTEDIAAPDYPERAVAMLEQCRKAGARGVGELSDKGFGLSRGGHKLEATQRLHADDMRLTPFFDKCGALGMPVNIHVADHPSAWQAPDVFQERTPVFQQFNKHGDGGLDHEALIGSLLRLVRKHPKTTFIACHLANLGHDLKRLAGILDAHPNLYIDISARDYELGRQPRGAAEFLTRYSERILFGTDMGMEKTMYQNWWRLLESADEHFEGRIWWRYYGLQLSDKVLANLYRNNARRVLNWA